MIDPATINPFALPSVPLEQRSQLPITPCIYFAIDSEGVVQYIGRSVNPAQRWTLHHKYSELNEMSGVRISYLHINDQSLLAQIESALIAWFKPLLNRTKNLDPFASGLMRLRLQAGLTAERVAVELDKSVSTIRFWEAGTYVPSLNPSETLQLIRLYKCSIEELSEAFEETQQKKTK
ncbi:helix-turn-helix domain-containing protein [Nostoc sp.]|uniref:helix-turn-helix domain-containing protein n=1 Tax=Nostoc sp. TaxID=1180 RepID=UPI002FF86E85